MMVAGLFSRLIQVQALGDAMRTQHCSAHEDTNNGARIAVFQQNPRHSRAPTQSSRKDSNVKSRTLTQLELILLKLRGSAHGYSPDEKLD